jgi:outer membrane protein OmpA-like peptidoglycan-associated protein
MRTTTRAGFVLVLVVTGVLTGCSSNLRTENALLTEENRDLRAQLDERNQALENAHQQLRDESERVAELRRQPDTNLDAAPGVGMGDPFSAIPGVTGSVDVGEVTASVESDVLFDSGKATLKASAKRSLDQVASILNSSYAGRPIRVAGHTDTDPIRKSGYKSNYHLGFERAYAVREYLVSRGIPATRIYVASHGPDRSLANKKESRRVEIVVVLNES